ncbi:hypothetical protein MBM_03224 [Drepanopeziza brunnea f. sp. 'multigermtubi' MB_m1]|uniref:Uncharacterized protein n=1 Tax=Marssonina brunnea f. sp. multigermtubi (strain MB_m1) TaxID=1072389 RepID=K1WZ34_MARBU|nr:uncharacterized protein MBM_03224 [Drepanopeziza brunnea f. sp. 'multigermtubi' MB_m1]EKD18231.1 hypothetical protein MBM_03224 [Drepanopeziza brunnea f. sp. 'multigermtubi' MB_m1]
MDHKDKGLSAGCQTKQVRQFVLLTTGLLILSRQSWESVTKPYSCGQHDCSYKASGTCNEEIAGTARAKATKAQGSEERCCSCEEDPRRASALTLEHAEQEHVEENDKKIRGGTLKVAFAGFLSTKEMKYENVDLENTKVFGATKLQHRDISSIGYRDQLAMHLMIAVAAWTRLQALLPVSDDSTSFSSSSGRVFLVRPVTGLVSAMRDSKETILQDSMLAYKVRRAFKQNQSIAASALCDGQPLPPLSRAFVLLTFIEMQPSFPL